MKNVLLLLCIAFFGFTLVRAQSIEMPAECKRILDKNFRGWKFADVQKEIIAWHEKNKFPYAPNFIKGDWNGDGKNDYAVLIEQGKLKNSFGETIGNRRLTIAFVKSGKSFKHFRFDGGDGISLMKKNSTDYDYETDQDFRYKNDAIFDYIWEKAGVSYVWENGKFKTIATSD